MDILGSIQQPEHDCGNYLLKVVIVVVHYKNFDNTVECVESIF